MNQYDPTKHGNDLLGYLADYTNGEGEDVCEWTWDQPDEPLDERESDLSHATAEDGSAIPVLSESTAVGPVHADGGEITVQRGDATKSATDDESDNRTVAESESASGSDPTREDEDLPEDDTDAETEVVVESETKSESDREAAAGTETEVEGEDANGDGGPSLTDLDSVSEERADDLRAAGFETVEDVYYADYETIQEVDDVGESRVVEIHESAGRLFHEAENTPSTTPDSPSEADETPETETETETDAETDSVSEGETETDAETDSVSEGETEQDRETEQATTTDDRDEKPTVTVEFTPEDEEAPNAGDNGSDAAARESEEEQPGYWSRIKETVSSPFAHPAAGKSQPDFTDIGVIDERKAVALGNAGFETVAEVYTADKSAVAAVEGIDKTNAGYIQSGAKQALDASDAPVPAHADESDESRHETIENVESAEMDPQPGESAAAESADMDDTTDESRPTKHGNDDGVQPTLMDIQQVGEDRADALREAGYEGVADVATAGQDALIEVEGIGGARAETISTSATDLLDEQPEEAAAEPAGGDD